jgi:hypothetical protein
MIVGDAMSGVIDLAELPPPTVTDADSEGEHPPAGAGSGASRELRAVILQRELALAVSKTDSIQ